MMTRRLDAKRGRMESDISELRELVRAGMSPSAALAEFRRRLRALEQPEPSPPAEGEPDRNGALPPES